MAVRVQREDFDLGAELKALTAGDHRIGGLASFVGLVRDMADLGAGAPGRSCHDPRALPGHDRENAGPHRGEAGRRWQLSASLIIHRYGRLEAGEQIVLVACAAPIAATPSTPAIS